MADWRAANSGASTAEFRTWENVSKLLFFPLHPWPILCIHKHALQELFNLFFAGDCVMPAVVDKEVCSGCANCVDVCPCDAIEMDGDIAVVDADACGDCGQCVDECPTDAITMED